MEKAEISHIRRRLLAWYKQEGRDLPWRNIQDPYRILVSEIMLQQTQVPRVKELYYGQWLNTFPDWEALAGATNGEVITAWAGLGYNRRALMLRDIAKQVVDGGVPSSREEWLTLKGIGPYTSAALTVFSLHQKAVPIDTNIRRVLGRIFFGKPYPQPVLDAKIETVGLALLSGTQFYDIPQALFDLATAYCFKVPTCETCPLKTECLSSKKFLSGHVRAPKQMVKKATETQHRNKPYPDRIYRGRILSLVREQGNVPLYRVGPAIDPEFEKTRDEKWIAAMVARLEKDAMVERDGRDIKFPK